MEISPTKSYWTRRISLVALGLAFFASIGCNTSSSLVQFQGTILVDGTPAKGAILLFHPDGGKSTTVSSGEAKEDGTFTLVTDTQPGIPPGNYIVTVTWPDPSHKVSDRDKMTGLAEPGKDLLNGRYVTKDRSGIKIEITAGTTKMAPIELKTK
jgi:hypothetical protein